MAPTTTTNDRSTDLSTEERLAELPYDEGDYVRFNERVYLLEAIRGDELRFEEQSNDPVYGIKERTEYVEDFHAAWLQGDTQRVKRVFVPDN